LRRIALSHNYGKQGFRDSMEQCRIVLIDDNWLAIAPAAACSGDVICIFQFGQAVCVLRPHEDCYWKLISGDCHVLGGDELLEKGDYYDVPIFPYKTYCEGEKGRMEVFTIC
jgi:hypothetical protein